MITAAELAEFDAELFPVDAWDEEQFTEEMALPGTRFIDARIDGLLIGYTYVQANGMVGHIHSIAVKEGYRRFRLAWLLSTIGLRWLRDQGCVRLEAKVRADNEASLGLSRAGGFEAVGRVEGYYRDGADAWIMARDLRRSTDG